MADLVTTRASLVSCVTTAAALDAASEALGDTFRIAPDEALIVAAPKAADKTIKAAGKALSRHDPHAMVLDASDAWTGLTVAGEGTHDIFSHLSQLELPDPEGFVQGDVGRLAAKVVVRKPGDRITIFVPAHQAHSLRERILALGVVVRSEPEPWSPT